MSDKQQTQGHTCFTQQNLQHLVDKSPTTYLGFNCSWALLPTAWTSWARTGFPWCRALENVQCTFCTYFLLLCILQQNHQTEKGTNGPEGMPLRDTSSPSSRGVTGVAKSLSQSRCLLCGTALSLPAVSSFPDKAPSHGWVIWAVSWHTGTVNPKHSYMPGWLRLSISWAVIQPIVFCQLILIPPNQLNGSSSTKRFKSSGVTISLPS